MIEVWSNTPRTLDIKVKRAVLGDDKVIGRSKRFDLSSYLDVTDGAQLYEPYEDLKHKK